MNIEVFQYLELQVPENELNRAQRIGNSKSGNSKRQAIGLIVLLLEKGIDF